MPEILHTTDATPLSDYRLFLRSNNGDAGAVDLSGELECEVFERLRASAHFAIGLSAFRHADGAMGERGRPCLGISTGTDATPA